MDNSQIRKIIGLYLEQLSYNIDPIAPEMGGAEMGVTPLGLIDITSPEEAEVAMTTVLTRDYCGNYIYEDASLERILTENGYIDRDGLFYAYIKDYQGNNRVTIDENGATHDITAYYPYGMPFTPFNDLDRYKYSGKEFDPTNGLNLYDFSARLQNSALCDFSTQDRLQEKYCSMSPYAYCAGNPISFIDPSGLFPIWNGKYGSECQYTDSDTHKSVSPNEVMSYIFSGSYTDIDSSNDDKEVTNNNITPFQLGIEWLSGKGKRNRIFTSNDQITKKLKHHSFISQQKKRIVDILQSQYNNGLYYNLYGNVIYDLSGIGGIAKYIKDYSTLFTLGTTGNLVVTYLGSYRLSWSVLNANQNVALVLFEASNSSTLQSALRPPVLGYTKFWKGTVGWLLNNISKSGIMSPTTQKIVWTEFVNF